MSDSATAVFIEPSAGELWLVLGRLGVALLAGGLIGIERQAHRRAAGLRTHILISLAAAAFMLAGGHSGDDLTRVVQGIAVGVGFIGAGSILKLPESGRIQGLTTAGGIWSAAAAGVAAGSGDVILAGVISVLTVVVTGVLGLLEARWTGGPSS